MHIQPILEGNYFHIYNRGVNGDDIFKEHRNYSYFLKQYAAYCSEVIETLAYALLKNHFHMLIYTRENVEVAKHHGEGTIRLNASTQLSHFFNSYAQSINKACKRTGPLFESPFRRKIVEGDVYLTSLVYYCHYNAQRHGLVKGFKEWPFSSYRSILDNDNSLLASQKVLGLFGGATAFEKMHENSVDENNFKRFEME